MLNWFINVWTVNVRQNVIVLVIILEINLMMKWVNKIFKMKRIINH